MIDAVDFKYLLLEHYKALGFDEFHLAILLLIDHLLAQKNHFITAEQLAMKMHLPQEEIDKKLVELVNRHVIEYVSTDQRMETSILPLKTMLMKQFQQKLIQQHYQPQEGDIHIFQWVEKAFGRTLSPLEIASIRDWLAFGYEPSLIQSTVKEAISKNKFSIRTIDKLLQKQTLKDNFDQEGHTGPSGQTKNIRQQIEKIKHEINQASGKKS
jgi:DNA replication protein